jgi:monothiol glutaredoxin
MAEAGFKDKVEELIRDNEVLLFMKGTPEQPRCGFSMRVVGVLDSMGAEYAAVDVLPALEPLREATGEIADWRTFPQLYVKGELVGGCDIVEELADSGELAEMMGVEAPGPAETPASAKQELQQDPGTYQSGPMQIENN